MSAPPSTLTAEQVPVPARGRGWLMAWLALALASAALWLSGKAMLPVAFDWPKAWIVPVRRWISWAMAWLVDSADLGLFTVREATRFLAAVVEAPYQAVLALLATGVLDGVGDGAPVLVPPLSWLSVVLLAAAAGEWAGGRRLAVLAGLAFLYLAVFGQWEASMVTLASIVVAVPLGVAGGLLIGLATFRSPRLSRLVSPLLDLMQTVPVFAYLLPILVLFGFGPVAAILATVIFAMPPMIRLTETGLAGVPAEVVDLGRMAGCTPRQLTWKVMVPAALPALMVGVNQVIMLSLNMVIIASMIGAGGLGFDVLAALRRLDIGAGVESGLAIVVLAVALDRLSQAAARREAALMTGALSARPRNPVILVSLAGAAAAAIAALFVPQLAAYPEGWTVTTAPLWGAAMEWINVHFFETLEAAKTLALTWLLVPVKRVLLDMPFVVMIAALGLAGLQLGGWRLAVLAAGLSAAIVAVGLWEQAMVTVYLCGVSVLVAMLIGLPLGILASGRPRLWTVLEAVIDTLQTLPSFVYLIPVVMLFRVGDFSAMIAIVAFAIVPAIRYTALGLMRADPQLVEAGVAAGCTPRQLLWKVKLRLALPTILVGLNQTVMLALSMLVITALVGTRDLGQEVYIGLTKADVGRGLVAGLAVAFIAIITDRLLSAGARRLAGGAAPRGDAA